jgi:hypothetical protein
MKKGATMPRGPITEPIFAQINGFGYMSEELPKGIAERHC